ncbi:hypothetical protein ACFWY6_12695 [Streptomyces sp. NPDC059037]|uniref:hypothetical protein n=1 Tax=Streptomyces sp. NPDC059037 TaxID=3346710 RepID=UPI003690CB90
MERTQPPDPTEAARVAELQADAASDYVEAEERRDAQHHRDDVHPFDGGAR